MNIFLHHLDTNNRSPPPAAPNIPPFTSEVFSLNDVAKLSDNSDAAVLNKGALKKLLGCRQFLSWTSIF